MKLKKIASLMLAGVMAISMLAGCSGNETPDEGNEIAPVTGAAAAINAELSENKGKISFTDDATLDDVVKAYYANSNINAAEWKSQTMKELTNDASAMNSVVKATKDCFANLNAVLKRDGDDKKISGLVVYGFNAKMFTKESVLKYIGQNVDQLELAEVNDAGTKNYVYTGAVSVNEVKSKGGEASIWVVTMKVTKDLADK